MERKKSLSALLRSDAQTAKNITEMYPADWNMDAVYQKAYRTYREQAANTAAAPTPTARQNIPLRQKITLRANRWITAACLMLTVGIAGGVAWMQMSVSEPPRTNPNETSSVTVPVEEILPEQTSLPETEQSAQTATAARSTERTLPPSETRTETQTALPSPSGLTAVLQDSDAPQTSADVPTAAETQPQPTAPQQTASQQTASQQTTSQQNAAQPTATQLTATQLTATQPTTMQPTTSRYTTTRHTTTQKTDAPPPSATTVRTTTRPSETTPNQTTIPDTEHELPAATDATSPPPNDPTGDNPPTDGAPSVTEPRLSVTDLGSEFSVAYDFEDQTRYPQPDFTVGLEDYTVSINRTEYSSSNLIANEETGAVAWVNFGTGARWQAPFKYSLYSYQETTVIQNGETSPAVLIIGDTNCFLIWFDGRYLCELGIKTEYKDELSRIAEAMITH